MPLRFQRRIRISPGASVNLNKRSISASFGLPWNGYFLHHLPTVVAGRFARRRDHCSRHSRLCALAGVIINSCTLSRLRKESRPNYYARLRRSLRVMTYLTIGAQ